MTKLKIALDVDGVLADVIESWINYNNKKRPKLIKEEIKKWDFWRYHRINRYDFYKELSLCWENWKSIPPTEKNLSKTTKKLATIGQLDIVTARERSTNNYVRNWLRHFDITFDNYVSVIDGTMKANLDYDVFIDDSPLNADRFLKNKKKILLYNQPWNEEFQYKDLYRIYSLSEGLDFLTSVRD